MSARYLGGIVSKDPLTLNPAAGNAANGVFTLEQYMQAVKNATWPGFDPYFNGTVLSLHGNGTNGSQNNTFLDGSTNNFTITRNGNTTQGTFSPFSLAAGQWSNYFDGTGDYLTITSGVTNQFDPGSAFTLEGWFYQTSTANCIIFEVRGNTDSFANADGILCRLFSNFNGSSYFQFKSGTAAISILGTTPPNNTWNHLAVGYNGTTTRLWINGVSVGTSTSSYTVPTYNRVTIGNNNNQSAPNPFFGYLSNMRFVKGTDVYGVSNTSITVPTTPLTAITNTSLLTCQSNRFVDNSTNAFAITRNGDVRVTPFSPFAPTAAYSAGTNGGSGYFDGTGDYLSATSNAAFGYGTGDFTIEFWLYLNSTALQTVFSNLTSASSTNPHIYINSTIRYYTANADRITGATLTVGQWYHIALVRASGSTRLYINGTQSGSTYTDSNNYGTTAPLGIGTYWNSGSLVTTDTINGYLSNIRVVKGTAVYTGAFTPPIAPISTSGSASASAYSSTTNVNTTFASSETSLLLNFTNAGIFDNTGKNALETVGNAQIDTSVKKYGTGSMEFDGTDDRIFTPSSVDLIMGTGNFTIEGWFYANSTSNKGIFQLSSTTGGLDPSAATANIAFALQTNGYTVYAANVGTTITSVVPSTTTWTHFAVVRSSGVTRLYINGSQAGSNITDTTNYAGGNLVVGGYYSTSFLFNGFIDDLRITKGVARYTANFTAQTSQWQDQ
jgi:hypothetical protein